jgi:hypothetical protein
LYEFEKRRKREERAEEEERVRLELECTVRKPHDAEPSPVVDSRERTN